MDNQFVNFRLVSSSSLNAGLINVSEAISYIAQNPTKYSPFVGLSNRNNMMDNVALFRYAEKNNITPISSVELDLINVKKSLKTVTEGFATRASVVEEKSRYAMLFIAKSFRGYQNLCKLQTILYTKSVNENKRGVVDDVFMDYPELLEDVFILSGGLNSGQNLKQYEGSFLFQEFKKIVYNNERLFELQNEKYQNPEVIKSLQEYNQEVLDEIYDFIQYWRDVSDGNFFIELQRQGTPLENEYIQFILPIANELGVPVIATQNVYFLKPEDFEKHEYMLAYRGSYTRYSTDYENKKQINCTPENYLKTNAQMVELFSDIPIAIENTIHLANECQFELRPIPKNSYHMPKLKGQDGVTVEDLFVEMANKGLDNVVLHLFKLYCDTQSQFNNVDMTNEELAASLYLPENTYFNKFKDWKNANLSIDSHGEDYVLNFIKNTQLYQEYKTRLDYEIDVITKLGFASYFVVVADMVQYAKDNEIPVGLGRGSGAGSLVAYAMKITDLDPLQFDLLFERFLNPARASMPDFDIDFETDRRIEVFNYLSMKYNALGVRFHEKDLNTALDKTLKSPSMAKIATSSLLGRSSSLEVAAASFGKLNNNGGFSRGIKEIFAPPKKGNTEFTEDPDLLLEEDETEITGSFAELAANNPIFTVSMRYGKSFREVATIANSFYGHTRSFSSHAAGAILSPYRLDDLSPIFVDKNGAIVLQQNMKDAESLGLIKFDLLGLLTLTYIDSVRKEINLTRENNKLPSLSLEQLMAQINVYDLNVYENIFKPADTTNVFQFESTGFMKTLREIKPTCFEDLIAAVALYRPGPMDNIPDYAAVKHGIKAKVDYAPSTPGVGRILDSTYGIPVYQEQIMEILQVYAGYSIGEADLVRRAMGKKDKAEMERQRNIFIEKAVARFPEDRQSGIEEEAIGLFNHIAKFAEYGFNKSHAAAYAKTAFITAWLKHYYPKEFYVGHLNVMYNHKKNNEIPKVIEQVLKHNIIVQSTTNINESGLKYSLNEKGEIVLPLNLGLSNAWKAYRLVELRDKLKEENNSDELVFDNINQVLSESLKSGLTFTEKDLTAMIKSGAFESIHKNEYGNLLGNVGKLIKSTIQKNENLINPVYKYLPSRFLEVKLGNQSDTIVLDVIRREVPLSQKLNDRFKLFGYLSDYGEITTLREKYFNGFELFQDADNTIQLSLKDIINNNEHSEQIIKQKVFRDIANWRADVSKKFYSGSKETILTWGMIVGFKKNKDAADISIQLDNKVIRIVSYADNFKNAKFELMTPYLLKMECSLDRDYIPEDTGNIDVETLPISWRLVDFFSIDNTLKQLSSSTQNPEKLPHIKFHNVNGLLFKYGKNDIETQVHEIVNILYDNYALHKDSIEKYKDILNLDNENSESVVEYNSLPVEVKLPNDEIIGIHINDLMQKNLQAHGILIELNFDKKMLLNNKLRHNAFAGNAVKSDNFEAISYQLENNVEFSKITPYIKGIDSEFLKQSVVDKINSSGEYLLYGYLKQLFRTKEDEINKLIMVDTYGQEIMVEAKFGRLKDDVMKMHLKTEQPLLLKVEYYNNKGEDKMNLLDFYTAGNIHEILSKQTPMIVTSIANKSLIEQLLNNEQMEFNKNIENIHENISNSIIMKFNQDTVDSGIQLNILKQNLLIKDADKLIELLNKENIQYQPLFYGDLTEIRAFNLPSNHEKPHSVSDGFVNYYENFNAVDNPINLAYQKYPNRGKLSNHFLTISDMKQNNDLYANANGTNGNLAITGVFVRKEVLKGGFERWVIADGSDIIKVSVPNGYESWACNLSDYFEGGSKYGEPLIWKVKVTQNNKGIFYNPFHAFSLEETAMQLTSAIYVKALSNKSKEENIELFSKATKDVLNKQLQHSNFNHLSKTVVHLLYNGELIQSIGYCKSTPNLQHLLNNAIGENVQFAINLNKEFYPVSPLSLQIPTRKAQYNGAVQAYIGKQENKENEVSRNRNSMKP